MEAATWDGPNIHRTSQRLGLRSEASRALREGPRARAGDGGAGRRGAADGRAVRRAARARARSTSAARRPEPPPIDPPARRARRATARRADPARAPGRDPAARSASTSRRAGDGLDVTVPPFRRNDVTREADLIEEVARIDGLEKLPATLPARRGAAGRLTPRQRLRRRAEDALVGRGLHEIVGWSFTEPGLRDRLRLPADDPRAALVALREPDVATTSRCCARRCSARCSTPRATTPRAGAADLALFEPGAVYLRRRRRPAARRAPRARRRCSPGALRAARRGRDAEPPRGRLLRRQGRCSAPCSTRCASPWTVARRDRAVPAPGPQRRACSPAASGSAGSASCTRSSPRAWDLERRRRRLRARPRRASSQRADAAPRRTRDLTSFPAVRQDLAVIVRRRRRRPRRVLAVVREAGGELLAGARGLRRLPRRAGGRGPRRRSRCALDVPRARPHADRRGGRARCASGSSPRCATSWGASCVPDAVLGRRRVRASPARSPRG